MLLQAFTVYYRVIQGYEGHCTQLNRLGNKLLVILSILEMTNMPLQFFLLSACTFFSLHPIFLPIKWHLIKEMSGQILVKELHPVWCFS